MYHWHLILNHKAWLDLNFFNVPRKQKPSKILHKIYSWKKLLNFSSVELEIRGHLKWVQVDFLFVGSLVEYENWFWFIELKILFKLWILKTNTIIFYMIRRYLMRRPGKFEILETQCFVRSMSNFVFNFDLP